KAGPSYARTTLPPRADIRTAAAGAAGTPRSDPCGTGRPGRQVTLGGQEDRAAERHAEPGHAGPTRAGTQTANRGRTGRSHGTARWHRNPHRTPRRPACTGRGHVLGPAPPRRARGPPGPAPTRPG